MYGLINECLLVGLILRNILEMKSEKVLYDISFIVPCKNESKTIKKCIESIVDNGMRCRNFEIVVVDNGSDDDTLTQLESYSDVIKVYELKGVNISELRNFGSTFTRNEWIAFIDADVELCGDWIYNLAKVFSKAESVGVAERLITGSTYVNPVNASWVQRVWYQQLVEKDKMTSNRIYINGGNLVLNRAIFEKIGGFDTTCVTGEDVMLCKKAIYNGAHIIKEQKIKAIHHGYPKDIWQFFKRERWHGAEMKPFMLRPWKSKELLYSYYCMSIAFLFIFVFIVSMNFLMPLLFSLLALAIPVMPLAKSRSGGSVKMFFGIVVLFVVYGFARATALTDILLKVQSCRK